MGRSLYKTSLFTLILLGTILINSSTTAFADQRLFGQLIVEGKGEAVLMNGESITNEMTISSATEIITSAKSSARISFGEVGQIGLAPDSKMNLDFSESKITGVLTNGQLTMSIAPNTEISIQTADGIVTNPDRSKNSVIIIDFVNGKTQVKAELGAAALNGVVLTEGESFSGGTTVKAQQTVDAGIFSGVLTSLAKVMRVDELLGIEPQTATFGTKISDSVKQEDGTAISPNS